MPVEIIGALRLRRRRLCPSHDNADRGFAEKPLWGGAASLLMDNKKLLLLTKLDLWKRGA
jgi:hypothetical protein